MKYLLPFLLLAPLTLTGCDELTGWRAQFAVRDARIGRIEDQIGQLDRRIRAECGR